MSLARSAIYELKTLVGVSRLALPIERARRPGRPVSKDTELVIESFPRSASSFVVTAIHMNERTQRRISDHTHMAGNVLEATQRGLPTLVIVREPADAVASFLVHSPSVSAAAAARGYARFHEPLLPHRQGFLVATFDEVTTDLGDVIDRLNRRFGTDLRPFEHTPEREAEVHEEIRRHYAGVRSGSSAEEQLASPSPRRRARLALARERYRSLPLDIRRRAGASYHAMIES